MRVPSLRPLILPLPSLFLSPPPSPLLGKCLCTHTHTHTEAQVGKFQAVPPLLSLSLCLIQSPPSLSPGKENRRTSLQGGKISHKCPEGNRCIFLPNNGRETSSVAIVSCCCTTVGEGEGVRGTREEPMLCHQGQGKPCRFLPLPSPLSACQTLQCWPNSASPTGQTHTRARTHIRTT